MESNRNYLCTERAHLMCPNMHFGILAQIESDYDFQKVRQSVGAIRDAHPFLRSVIAQEEASGRLYYQAQEHLGIFVEETSADCGACDVCLDEKTDDKDNDWEKALDMVKQTLNDKRRHKIQDLMQLDIPMELLAEIMTYMTNEELIACEDDEVYLLKAT